MTKVSVSYIAGLYDGDGSFSVELAKHPSIPTGFQIKPEIILCLKNSDSQVFRDIIETFPEFRFTVHKTKVGSSMLRLRNEIDVSKFLKIVRPYIRIFSNVRRAEILEEITDYILNRGYGSKENFDFLLYHIAELRRYSKRVNVLRSYNISDLLGKEVKGKDIKSLIEESKSYIPKDFDSEYLAGLFDAEGYVGLCFHRNPKATFGCYLQPILNLNLAIYDAGVLLKLKEKFSRFNALVKFRESNNTAYFQISSRDGIETFIKTIYPFSRLPSSKARFDLILEALELIENKTFYNDEIWNKLLKINEELRKLSKRRRLQKNGTPFNT